MDVPELDDLTFKPTTWDLAMSIGLMADPETDRDALDELADAMLVWADEKLLDSLTDAALPLLWDSEIEAAVREGLVRLAEDAEWSEGASESIEALDVDSGRSEIAREVVRHLAMQLGQADQPILCLSLLHRRGARELRSLCTAQACAAFRLPRASERRPHRG